ncbi:MAG: hypothetical protein ABI995_04805, partial [Acidobacteriota bacterium]
VWCRLRNLATLYQEADTFVNLVRRPIRANVWEVPDEASYQLEFLAEESRVLVSFVYYELTSLAHMLDLDGFNISIGSGELQYLVKARDKFLAHPLNGGRLRNAKSTISIPQDGLLHSYALSVFESDPLLAEYYANLLGSSQNHATEEAMQAENERLIRSGKQNKKFLPDEVLRLKAFGIREPDLDLVFAELADLLSSKVLPKIQSICQQPIPTRS